MKLRPPPSAAMERWKLNAAKALSAKSLSAFSSQEERTQTEMNRRILATKPLSLALSQPRQSACPTSWTVLGHRNQLLCPLPLPRSRSTLRTTAAPFTARRPLEALRVRALRVRALRVRTLRARATVIPRGPRETLPLSFKTDYFVQVIPQYVFFTKKKAFNAT